MARFSRTEMLAFIVASGFAAQSDAHMYSLFPTYFRGGIPNKDQFEAYYQEWVDAYIYFNMAHACAHVENETDIRSTQTAVVLPTAPNAVLVRNLDGPYDFKKLNSFRELGSANAWALKAEVKPMGVSGLDHYYKFYSEPNPTYFTPANAIVWVGDGVPDSGMANFGAMIGLPRIPKSSCVKEVDYFFATAQFCPKATGTNPENALNTFAMSWLLGATKNWPEELQGGAPWQWAPYVRMLRDLKTKPLDPGCGAGEVVSVYPGQADIDRFLKPVEVDAQGVARQIPVQQWIRRNRE